MMGAAGGRVAFFRGLSGVAEGRVGAEVGAFGDGCLVVSAAHGESNVAG